MKTSNKLLFCPLCFEREEIVPLHDDFYSLELTCPVCGEVKYALRGESLKNYTPYRGRVELYENYLDHKKGVSMPQENNGSHYYLADNKLALAKAKVSIIDQTAEQIVGSNLLPKNLPSDLVGPASRAAAILAVEYGIDIRMSEAYIASFDSGRTWGIVIGYKGQNALMSRSDLSLGDYHFFGKPERLSEQEIVDRRAHVCSACSGRGEFNNGNKCFACDKRGQFDPSEVIAVKVAIHSQKKIDSVLKAKEAGIELEYEPDWGYGVWQPGDNAPKTRDAQWVAEKRARVAAQRIVTSVSMVVDGHEFDISSEDEVPYSREIEELREIKDEITQFKRENPSLSFDDIDSFAEVIKGAIDNSFFGSVDEIGRFMIDKNVGFEVGKKDLFKQMMYCYHKEYLPLSSEVFKDMPQVDRVLLAFLNKMNPLLNSTSESIYDKSLKDLTPVQLSNLLSITHSKNLEEVDESDYPTLDTPLIEWSAHD